MSSMKCIFVGLLFAFISSTASAALIGINNGTSSERTPLVSTLASLGHTVTTVIDANLDLIITAPGNLTSDFPGVPYLQISDHGVNHIANSFTSHADGTPVTISLSGAHPILTGVSPSWTTLGFWNYSPGSSYIGHNAVPGLANAVVLGTGFSNVLALAGSDIYIGWNVYGPEATSDDILLLRNTIEFLTTGSVTGSQAQSIPTLSEWAIILLSLLLIGVGLNRSKRVNTI